MVSYVAPCASRLRGRHCLYEGEYLLVEGEYLLVEQVGLGQSRGPVGPCSSSLCCPTFANGACPVLVAS